ncbi:MAG: hypothetical protein AAF846_21245 [Chloroflexota bacterium]
MFIRWIVRKHKNSEVANVNFHDAYLVESYRDENGSPRQRTISYLGNIREMDGEFPIIERELFLLRASHILSTLPNLSAADETDVVEQLQRRVPPLETQEVLEGFRNTLRWYCQWWQDNGGMPSEETLLEHIQIAQRTASDLVLDE